MLQIWKAPYPTYASLDGAWARVDGLGVPDISAPFGIADLAAADDGDGDGSQDLVVVLDAGANLPEAWYFPFVPVGTSSATAIGFPINQPIGGFNAAFVVAEAAGDTSGLGSSQWAVAGIPIGGISGVFTGVPTGPVEPASFTWTVSEQIMTLDAGTDVDGDGLDDVLVGGLQTGGGYGAWLYLGGTAGP